MRFPAELRYSKEHLWVCAEDKLVKIGLTEFAQYEIGEVSSVKVNRTWGLSLKGEVFGTLEAARMNWSLHLPVTGKIRLVNPALKTKPSLINKDPYGEGWIIKLSVAHKGELEELMHAIVYMGGW